MVIDEIFHLLVDQLVHHILFLPRESIWLYHALQGGQYYPSTRAGER